MLQEFQAKNILIHIKKSFQFSSHKKIWENFFYIKYFVKIKQKSFSAVQIIHFVHFIFNKNLPSRIFQENVAFPVFISQFVSSGIPVSCHMFQFVWFYKTTKFIRMYICLTVIYCVLNLCMHFYNKNALIFIQGFSWFYEKTICVRI